MGKCKTHEFVIWFIYLFFCLEYFHITQYNTYKLENYVILTYYNTRTEHTPTLQKREKKTWKTTNYSNYKIYHLTGRKITGRELACTTIQTKRTKWELTRGKKKRKKGNGELT